MDIKIRRAEEKDSGAIMKLLQQVLAVHAEKHPRIFIPGTTKYSREDLKKIIADDMTPVFVAEAEGKVIGHAFTAIQYEPETINTYADMALYIDDICVDERARQQGAATALYEAVRKFAESSGCRRILLNVWAGNDEARGFYEKMGFEPMKTTMQQWLD